MGQIPQVAEHARVFDGRLLTALVGLVYSVWTDKGEYALKNCRRESSRGVAGRRSKLLRGNTERGRGEGAIGLAVLLLAPEPLHGGRSEKSRSIAVVVVGGRT